MLGLFGRIFNRDKVTLDLDDIQAIVLRDRPAPYYGTIGTFRIRDAALARALLSDIFPMICSAADWHTRKDPVLSLAFSFEGLKKIGLPEQSLDSFPDSFREGMAARAGYLLDLDENSPKRWEKGLRAGDIHCLAAIVANSRETYENTLTELKKKLDGSEAIETVMYQEFGTDEKVRNVFGFRDGISNPEIEGSGIDLPPGYDDPVKAGEFILGQTGESGIAYPYPQPDVLGKNGSFLAFRKYQSLVAGFNKFIQENSDSLEEGELLAAKLVGRWRSGAPLVLSPEKDDPALGANDSANNNFSFKSDPNGRKCPFGSHVRRMNPRDSPGAVLEDIRLHRIARRSFAFGDVVPPDVTKDDGKERGLYFFAISARAMETLEFLQKQWINNGNSQNLGEEKDPLLGVQEDGLFTVPDNVMVKRYRGLQTFNIVKGGEYFFIPGLSALKWISKL